MMSHGVAQRPPKGPAPPPPKPRKGLRTISTPTMSTYLMNDIPRDTPRMKLINSLLSPSHAQHPSLDTPQSPTCQPDVAFGLKMIHSRLDDELNVASIEFTDTPLWLQALNADPCGFPKRTLLGTIWKGVDRSAIDAHGQTAFIRAVIDGGLHLHFAEMLAEFPDTDVNIQDDRGRTALHWACAGDLADMVRLCLSVPECDVGLRDCDGFTAFDLSLESGNEIITTVFYKDIVDMDERDPQTALLRALTMSSEPGIDKPVFPGVAMFNPIQDRNRPLVQALIARGVDLTAKNQDGDTALHVAARIEDVEAVGMLLEAGSDVNARGHGEATPLHCAARTANQNLIEVLLYWEADTSLEDEDGQSAASWAAQQGDSDIARLLLGHEADASGTVDLAVSRPESTKEEEVGQVVVDISLPDIRNGEIESIGAYGRTALRKAVVDGDLDRVVTLLGMGADTEARDTDERTALHLAAGKPNIEIVKVLLAKGAKILAVDDRGDTALHMAARLGNMEIIKILLVEGAEIHARCKSSWTALHEAANAGNVQAVQFLIAKGAQLDVQDTVGCTPLHRAASGGHVEAVQFLIANGAQINVQDTDGSTSLHRAASEGHVEVVQFLIAKGAQIDVQTTDGSTPLHWAVNYEDQYVMKTLITSGADLDVLGPDGSALEVALRRRKNEMVNILVSAGASTGTLPVGLWGRWVRNRLRFKNTSISTGRPSSSATSE